MVNIKLTGQFKALAPAESKKGEFTLQYEAGMSLPSLISQLGVDKTGVKYNVIVNNVRKPADYVIKDSDSITVMPLLAGG
jgi:molybdopterin converting factor small subunit